MAHLLAIDWDRHEFRFLLAHRLGSKKIRLTAAARLPWESEPVDEALLAEESGPDSPDKKTDDGQNKEDRPAPIAPEVQLGRAIRAALAEKKIPRATTLVGIDRRSVDLIHCHVPPASNDELPGLVTNMAMQESAFAADDATLDFLPLSFDPSRSRDVLAALLPRQQKEAVETVCETAGLKPTRLLLRPVAAASLFARTTSPEEKVCLLVNRVGNEIDLSLFVEGQIVFSRTAQLPDQADASTVVERAFIEINRTLTVSQERTAESGEVETIYLFGTTQEHEPLVEAIETRLDMAAKVIDPFATVELPEKCPADATGSFAPLMGMILDELDTKSKKAEIRRIDFLNPRRAPVPPNRKRLFTIVGVLAIGLLGFGLFDVWDRAAQLDQKNQALVKEINKLKSQTKKTKKKQAVVAAFRKWHEANVNWLDELRDLSIRFPSSRDAVVLKMNLNPGRGGNGGTISYYGLVRDPSVIVQMESQLRDSFHEIRSKRVQERGNEQDYAWRFETTMNIAGRPKGQYTSHLSPEELDALKRAAEAKEAKKKTSESTSKKKTSKPQSKATSKPTAKTNAQTQ